MCIFVLYIFAYVSQLAHTTILPFNFRINPTDRFSLRPFPTSGGIFNMKRRGIHPDLVLHFVSHQRRDVEGKTQPEGRGRG